MAKIVFNAVSQGMANLAAKVAGEMNLQVIIEVSKGPEVQKVVESHQDAEVYISRGGTAQMLQKLTDRPVVELRASVDEILEAIQKLIVAGEHKIAIVADENVIGEEESEFKIASVDILKRPIRQAVDKEMMLKLSGQGVTGIIGGPSACNVGKEIGLAVEFLENGTTSIKKALTEAVKVATAQENLRLREEEKIRQIQQSSSTLYTELEQAASAVEELAASSQELAATSHETAEIAKSASREVDSTTEILAIIQRVAQQTNLLGLNAAIEAARAGEHGRGFSVVAEEVRKLADESNNSARDINDMLQKFRNSVERVSGNVQQSNIICQEQAKANQEMAQTLERLRDVGRQLIEITKRTA